MYDDDNGGVLQKYDCGNDGAIGYYYDDLNRVNDKYMRHGENADMSKDWQVFYEYKDGASANQTTSLLSNLKYNFGVDGSKDTFTLNYTYDNLGNITKVTKTEDGETSTVGRYVYDEMNQLVLEDVYDGKNSYTKVYKYDTYGNIRSEKKYRETGYYTPYDAEQGTLLEEKKYTYGNSTWRDLLTAYDGHTISYDAIGNPTTYYNGEDTYNFTWERGRQLKSAETTDSKRTITYTYNKDGIRTGKKVDDREEKLDSYNMTYRLDGDKIVEIKLNAGWLKARYEIIYDESGRPYSIEEYMYGEANKYYYILNAQGDVIELRREDGTVQAAYTYDAWGKILSIYDADDYVDVYSISNVNPFRYRGYVYDQDTNLYYCQSRYYDPQIRRFINADAQFDSGSEFLGHNLFAYCSNNTVVRKDVVGTKWVYCVGSIYYMPKNFYGIDGKYYYSPTVLDLLFNATGKALLEYMDCPLARWMYNYAFGNDGSQIEYSSLPPMLEDTLINSQALHNILGMYIAKGEWFDTGDQSVQFINGQDTDLFYAVQKADYRAWGWTENGRWKINIFVWDDYDFDNFRFFEGSFLADCANNLGYALQTNGAMTPYHWWIRYEYYY